jgi:23S rRNA (uridine2552-2'-O)-methyltransferase
LGSGLGDRNKRHDRFFKKARQEGFAARAVYKLEEIDKRFRLLRAGDRVLDLGCRPGSWMQYALTRVGQHGRVIGIDRDPLPSPIPQAKVLVADIFATTDQQLLDGLTAFDVVLSDMAPDTTGIRSVDQARSANLVTEALARAVRLLAPGGHFVAKIFQGPDVEPLRRQMKERFGEVNLDKPESSRKESPELFLVAKHFTPAPV